jgi:quercetin dioxygenase-like cupin family protein
MNLIRNISPRQLAPGITGHYAHGQQLTFGYVEIDEGSSIPLHQHPQEQITYIISGELDMVIGEANCLLKEGMYHVIPANIPHSAIARKACRVIDAFSPVREDYRT